MRRATLIKHHKWFGLAVSLFLLMFCVSGVLLNHRQLISGVNVSRKWLPSRYEYSRWNGGLLRGTLPTDSAVLIYGGNGIFGADRRGRTVSDFNEGLPTGADYRQIRGMATVQPHYGGAPCLFAVSPFALYRYGAHEAWHTVGVPTADGERLTDITAHGDTLVVLGRSFAYVAMPPYCTFSRVQLPRPADYDGCATAFRTVWMLHSGELFGGVGKAVVDATALAIALLCVSGLVFWLLPKLPRRLAAKTRGRLSRLTLLWHDRIGRYTIALTLLVCCTGWCLRPPLMIPLALSRIPTLPLTTLHSSNPWHDKLRMVRHDDSTGEWLVSTSEGFYSIRGGIGGKDITRLKDAPPVSVMGLNVWQKDDGKDGNKWLCGSFSGLFVWNRATSTSTDYFTHRPAPRKQGPPFGQRAIAGFSSDFYGTGNVVAEYYDGTRSIPQPEWMSSLPMSLWNMMLEVHSGRIYIGSIATYIFVFVAGIAAIWALWTGYKLRRKRKSTRQDK